MKFSEFKCIFKAFFRNYKRSQVIKRSLFANRSQGIAAQFYVGVQSGIGDIKSDINITAPGYKIKHAGAVKVGYIYSFTNHFGIGTGLEFSKYNQEISLKNSTETLTNFEIDPSTSAFV